MGVAVQQVKQGLEQEGLTGLGDDVWSSGGASQLFSVQRRERFRGQDIFLPKVLHKDNDGWRELDYQRHVLPNIDWRKIESFDPQASLPDPATRKVASVDVGDAQPVFYDPQELNIDKSVKISYFARRLSDVLPNPWQAARVAQDLIQRLRDAGESDDEIYDRRSYLAFALREHVTAAVEKQAEHLFGEKTAHWRYPLRPRSRRQFSYVRELRNPGRGK